MSSSDSKMERLRKRLYSQDQPDAESDDSSLSQPEQPNTPQDWKHEHKRSNNTHDWLNKLLIFAGVFCVLAAGFAIATIWLGESGVSPNQVDISVSGPSTVSAGETAEFTVNIQNNNQVPLQDVSLTLAFPPGTRRPDAAGGQLRRIRKNLDTLSPGESRNVTLSASLFGQQDETKTIDVSLGYRVPESNAIFSASSQYAVTIGELPVSIAIKSPNQTAPGQLVNFQINIRSNSAKLLSNVILRANYPFGFSTTDISPQPMHRNRVWSLGDIQPGGTRTINISGRFSDSISAGRRTFNFSVGIASSQSSTTIATMFADRESVLSLREPYIDLTLDLSKGSQSRPIVLSPGQSISGDLSYKSNLDTPVRGASVDLKFLGSGINLDSITSEQGLYRQSEATISWNTQTSDKLQLIEPNESGRFTFSFKNKTGENLVGVSNPTAKMQANLRVGSPQGGGLPNTISAEAARSPRLHSDVSVETATLHDNGPFTTSGPLPPQVGETTEYTVHFTVRNTTNDLRNVSLQAAVPAYVQISGEPQMSNGSFTYNNITGRLRWKLPELAAGAGYDRPPAEIFIPIEITPTDNQANSQPQLLTDVILTAKDVFAGNRIELNNLTTPTTRPSGASEDADLGSVQARDE